MDANETRGPLSLVSMSSNVEVSNKDRSVLTIFLPILAVAILLCAGGCCYMEKKRKRRLKRKAGVVEPEIDDNASVITTSSSKYRPYLLPTETTGRTYRTPSRISSRRSSHAYDLDSQYGEPPPYSGSRRSIYDGNNRSRSMADLRDDPQRPMRRSRSFSVGHSTQSVNVENVSPAASEWSVRTAPQMRDYNDGYGKHGKPSSVASLPVSRGNRKLRRSASQPNLGKTRTYPQGILKRNASSFFDDYAVESSNQDSGMFGDSLNDKYQDGLRPATRSQAGYGSVGSHYYREANPYQGYPNQAYEDPVYAVSQAHSQYGQDWRSSYPASYDPYASNYWQEPSNTYMYGAY